MLSIKFIVLSALFVLTASAQTPTAFTYGGRLATVTGAPQIGAVTLTFDIFASYDTATILCTKSIPTTLDGNGVFNVTVDYVPADCGSVLNPAPAPFETILSEIASTPPIGMPLIRVNDGTTTYPMQAINASPIATYAITANALIADGSITQQKLQGPGPGPGLCPVGDFLTVLGTGDFACVTPVGQVATVTAGNGLVNSGTAADPVLDVNVGTGLGLVGDAVYILNNGVDSAQINANAITTVKIGADQVTFGAGGKLDNTTCANGQVLKKAGGVWNCGADTGNIFATGTVNQIPKYDGTGDSLVDSNIADDGLEINITGDVDFSGRLIKNNIDFIDGVDAQNSIFVGFGTNFATAATGTTLVGASAGDSVTGNNNTMLGYAAGSGVTSGVGNVYVGAQAGSNASTGSNNTAMGVGAATLINTGFSNTLIGETAGVSLTDASENTFLGSQAGENITTENNNTFIGAQSGQNNAGAGNVFLGYQAGQNVAAAGFNNKLVVDNVSSSFVPGNFPLIYGDFASKEVWVHDICDEQGGNCKDISGGWGLGTMNNFNISGDTGTTPSVADADTVNFVGGNGLGVNVAGVASPYVVTFTAPQRLTSLQAGINAAQVGVNQLLQVTVGTGATSAIPRWDLPAANTHQLFLPTAASAGTTAGLLGNLDYVDLRATADLFVGAPRNDTEWCYYNNGSGTIICDKTSADMVNPTANMVTKSTGTAFVDTVIHDNGAGIAINTTTHPAGSVLRVAGGMISMENNRAISYTTTGAAQRNMFVLDGADDLIIGSDSGDGANTIRFRTEGQTDALHINSNGQVGLGTAAPNATALLDMTSTTLGLLPPRMTTAQRAGLGTVSGMTIYNVSDNKLQYYNGTVWADMGVTSAGISAGSANYITKYNPGGTDVVNSLFFDNGTDVGINDNTPTSALDLNHTVPVIQLQDTDNASGSNATLSNVSFRDSADAEYGSVGDTDAAHDDMTLAGTNGVRIDTAGTDRIYVLSTGEVGVGVAVPTEDFEVGDVDGSGNAFLNVSGGQGYIRADSTGPNAAVLTANTIAGQDSKIRFDEGGTGRWAVGNDGGDGDKFKIANNQNLGTNTRFTMLSTGEVGLGTATPAQILHAYKASGSTTITAETALTGAGVLELTGHRSIDGSAMGKIDFANSNGGGGNVARIAAHREAANDAANLRFLVFNSGGALTERMRIDSTGHVAIGITGAPHASAKLHLTDADGGVAMPLMTTAQRNAVNAGTFQEGLQVYNTTDKKMQFWDGVAWQNMDGGTGMNAGTANYLVRYNGAGTNAVDSVLYEDGAGNIGINTAAPVGNLEVVSTAGLGDLMVRGAAGTAAEVNLDADAGTANRTFLRRETGAAGDFVASNDGGTTDQFVMKQSGAVAIGHDTIPGLQKLYVEGSAKFSVQNTMPANTSADLAIAGTGDANASFLNLEDLDTGDLWQITNRADTAEANTLQFRKSNGGNAPVMTLEQGRDVGIGTANPNSRLDVYDQTGTITHAADGLHVTANSTGVPYTAVIENDHASANGLNVSAGGNGAQTSEAFSVQTSDRTETAFRIKKNATAYHIASFEDDTRLGMGSITAPQYLFQLGPNNADSVSLDYYNFTTHNSSIGTLVGGTTAGGLIVGGEDKNLTVGLRDDTVNDAFNIVSGGGNWNSDSIWDLHVLSVKAGGDIAMGGIAPSAANENVFTVFGTGAGDRSAVVHLDASGYTGGGANVAYQQFSSIAYAPSAGNDGLEIGMEDSTGLAYFTRSQGTLTAGLAGFVLDTTGNMGINITNPTERLHVAGNVNVTGQINVAQICDETGATCKDIDAAGWTAASSGAADAIQLGDGATGFNSDALFVFDDTNNYLGIGSATPGKAIEINHGNPDLRLRWAAVPTNDQAGIDFNDNGTVKGLIAYNRTTNTMLFTQGADTPGSGHLQFQTAGANRMRIDYAGQVGIGTTVPNDALDVVGDIDATGCLQVGNAGSVGGACVSDKRLKKNIRSIAGSLDKVLSLNPVKYIWRPDFFDIHKREGSELGLIAQEVEEVFPEMIVEGDDGYKRVRYDISLQMHMISAFREFYGENKIKNEQQDREIANLKTHVNKLELENQILKSRLDRIEQLLSK